MSNSTKTEQHTQPDRPYHQQQQQQYQQGQLPPQTVPAHPNAKTISTTNSANGSTTTKTNITSPVCRNCKTQTTPLWRRDETGQVLCNACGLFLKLHGRPRPISLKTDVIKSRNRAKHNSSNNVNGKSNPNTPELKAKEPNGNSTTPNSYFIKSNDNDRQPLVSYNMKGAKFSPKQYKPNKGKSSPNSQDPQNGKNISSPGLMPLLPRQQQEQQAQQSQSQINTPNSPFGFPQNYHQGQMQGYSAKFPHQHMVQPLHYPSSTPAQFAPNLTSVTSPLLLSTTAPKFNPSQSSERASLKSKDGQMGSLVNAAGALETMSQEPLDHDKKIPNIKLDNDKPSVPHFNNFIGNEETKYSSPSTELNGGTKLPALVAAANSTTSPQQQPHLTPSNAMVTSPSFGPQFSLSRGVGSPNPENGHYASPSPLPSLKPLLSDVHSQQQQQQNQQSTSSPLARPYNQPPSTMQQHIQQLQQPSHSISPMIMAQTSSSSTTVKREDSAQENDPVYLRTRISELELVNDLFKTRIVELEALESASKQREQLLKKRLDELKGLPVGMMDHSENQVERDSKRMKMDN